MTIIRGWVIISDQFYRFSLLLEYNLRFLYSHTSTEIAFYDPQGKKDLIKKTSLKNKVTKCKKTLWKRKKKSDTFAKKPLKIYKNGPKYFEQGKELTFIFLPVEILAFRTRSFINDEGASFPNRIMS